MAVLIFELSNVPEHEAQEVRQILLDNEIDYADLHVCDNVK